MPLFSFRRRSVPEISVDELDQLLRDRTVKVVDVREDWEYRRGHVPTSLHVPLNQLPRRVGNLPVGERIAVICESGSRSLSATEFLAARGFEDVASVRGGTSAWIRSGRPVARGSA
jgi:rhodanese-related sulfurtransferase